MITRCQKNTEKKMFSLFENINHGIPSKNRIILNFEIKNIVSNKRMKYGEVSAAGVLDLDEDFTENLIKRFI